MSTISYHDDDGRGLRRQRRREVHLVWEEEIAASDDDDDDDDDKDNENENDGISHVRRIFLGSQHAASKCSKEEILEDGITGIVNCTKSYPNHHHSQYDDDDDDDDEEKDDEEKDDEEKDDDEKRNRGRRRRRREQQDAGIIEYCRVAVNDEMGANILRYLDGAACFIRRHLTSLKKENQNGDDDDNHNSNNNKKKKKREKEKKVHVSAVLVHCQMGISRSATIVMAYLMKYHGMNREQAYTHVKRHRSQVNPNPGFWTQLGIFETRQQRMTMMMTMRRGSPLPPPPKRNDPTGDEKEEPRTRRMAINGASDVMVRNEGPFGEFDREWAEESLARYHTVGSFAELDPVDLCPEMVHWTPADSDQRAVAMITAAIDCVLGRGWQEADLSWLGALCRCIYSSTTTSSSRLGGGGGGEEEKEKWPNPRSIFEELMKDGSEFREDWGSDLYPNVIERLREVIHDACR